MRHSVSGEIKELSREQFLALFDSSVHPAIDSVVSRYPTAQAVVCFENLDLCSSQAGHRSALVVGPENTTKLEDLETRRLGDVPSRFQYPVALWRIGGVR